MTAPAKGCEQAEAVDASAAEAGGPVASVPDGTADEVTPNESRAGGFSDRVLVMFVAQVVTTAIGIMNGLFLARLVGPSGKGEYALLTLLPATLMVLVQLGLPQAFGFYAARGQTLGLTRKSVTLTIALSLPVVVGAVALLPVLGGTFMRGIAPAYIILAMCTLPLALNATLTTGIVIGRQAVMWFAAINFVQYVSASVLLLVVVGVLGQGVPGAVAVFVATYLLLAGGLFIAASRVTGADAKRGAVSYRELFRYGLPFYPGSATSFFDYRFDVYLLAWLLADPSASLGYYTLAVSMAELPFFFPSAVSALFFPRVAESTREEADRQAPLVSRVTLLFTGAGALASIPFALLVVQVLLPRFGPSLPAFGILLPAVVALSVTKVLTGYVSGLGLTGLTSVVNVSAFVLNLLANFVLIPRFGIAGAATASLISYGASSVAFTIIASRLTRVSPTEFWRPRPSDVRFAVATSLRLVRRLLPQAA